MNDHLLDELIQMDTWDWWKSQLFVLREQQSRNTPRQDVVQEFEINSDA